MMRKLAIDSGVKFDYLACCGSSILGQMNLCCMARELAIAGPEMYPVCMSYVVLRQMRTRAVVNSFDGRNVY